MLISTPFLFSPFFRNLEPQSKTAYQMTIDEIKEKLASKKSPDRRRAAKEIGKTKAAELDDLLYESYPNAFIISTWVSQVLVSLISIRYRSYNRSPSSTVFVFPISF